MSVAHEYAWPYTTRMPAVSPRPLTIVTIALAWLPGLPAASAQDATAWQIEAHAEARLIAGALVKTPHESFVRAGIQIRLDPGWKTYWRYPGDTGMPPTIEFAGSNNVKSATVLWPAPERFSDGAGGHSIGYLGEIILPLRVAPTDLARASALYVQLKYAICGTLCVPAGAKLNLALSGKGGDEGVLQKAEQRVPKRVALGPNSGNALAVLSVHREPGGAHDRVVVEMAAPAGVPVDLFAEGPTPDWALPLPEPHGPENGAKRRFTFDLDGLPAGAEAKGAALILTAVSGDDAIEVPVHLD
jgi:DsbC/DsbD-like thiol-disulfide interchange protein